MFGLINHQGNTNQNHKKAELNQWDGLTLVIYVGDALLVSGHKEPSREQSLLCSIVVQFLADSPRAGTGAPVYSCQRDIALTWGIFSLV